METIVKLLDTLVKRLADLCVSFAIAVRTCRYQLIESWVFVPGGVILILTVCFGIDRLLSFASFDFPASIIGLFVLLLTFFILEKTLGEERCGRVVAVIEIPAGWCLRWVNVAVIPSFVLLPLSPSSSVAVVFKIIAVFLIGYLVMMTLAVYGVRGLQYVFNTRQVLGEHDNNIDLEAGESSIVKSSAEKSTCSVTVKELPSTNTEETNSVTDSENQSSDSKIEAGLPHSQSLRREAWATTITQYSNLIIYTLLFLTLGVPLYYATGYSMPIQLTFTIMANLVALSINPNPTSWRQLFHPILISSAHTILGLWVIGLTRQHDLFQSLSQYRTGVMYTQLWSAASGGILPGAADVLSSLLDACIVSLAIPMYQHRQKLRDNFFMALVPSVIFCVGCLFLYPIVCFHVGIGSGRSLAFAFRTLTLPLAMPATRNLGGDLHFLAPLTLGRWVSGVFIGWRMLDWLKVPKDDFVTRGVTLGITSSTLGIPRLLLNDPPAAALASLSVALYGILTLILTSIPPCVGLIQSLVGR